MGRGRTGVEEGGEREGAKEKRREARKEKFTLDESETVYMNEMKEKS